MYVKIRGPLKKMRQSYHFAWFGGVFVNRKAIFRGIRPRLAPSLLKWPEIDKMGAKGHARVGLMLFDRGWRGGDYASGHILAPSAVRAPWATKFFLLLLGVISGSILALTARFYSGGRTSPFQKWPEINNLLRTRLTAVGLVLIGGRWGKRIMPQGVSSDTLPV